jgi:hypothetical protein
MKKKAVGMDPQSQLRYAELLAQNREYISAANILDALQKKGSDNNSKLLQARKEGFIHPEKFTNDSLRYHVQYLNINSLQSDYSPRYYGQGIVYISNRITNDRSTREMGSNGNTYSRLYQVKDASCLQAKTLSENGTSLFTGSRNSTMMIRGQQATITVSYPSFPF